jgi:hypothetical protein
MSIAYIVAQKYGKQCGPRGTATTQDTATRIYQYNSMTLNHPIF